MTSLLGKTRACERACIFARTHTYTQVTLAHVLYPRSGMGNTITNHTWIQIRSRARIYFANPPSPLHSFETVLAHLEEPGRCDSRLTGSCSMAPGHVDICEPQTGVNMSSNPKDKETAPEEGAGICGVEEAEAEAVLYANFLSSVHHDEVISSFCSQVDL